MIKKLFYLLYVSIFLFFSSITLANFSDNTEFTSTIVLDATFADSDPELRSEYDVKSLHMMHIAVGESIYGPSAYIKTSNHFPNAPTQQNYLLHLTISETRNNDNPLCIVEYNALTKTTKWIVKNIYQPFKGSLSYTCHTYHTNDHFFLFIVQIK